MSRRRGWRHFFQRTGWLDGVGIAGVVAVTLLALLAPWLAPYDPQLRVGAAMLPPSASHWFGTDEIGRDLFSRALLGMQYTWWLPILPASVIMVVCLLANLAGDGLRAAFRGT
jgi:peptide/nickel transport system permease protein